MKTSRKTSRSEFNFELIYGSFEAFIKLTKEINITLGTYTILINHINKSHKIWSSYGIQVYEKQHNSEKIKFILSELIKSNSISTEILEAKFRSKDNYRRYIMEYNRYNVEIIQEIRESTIKQLLQD